MALEVATGARIKFTIAGVTVGLATRTDASDEIDYQAVEVLNNIEPLEHVAVGYRATLTASQVRIIGQTLTTLGFYPKKGGTPQDFLRNILTLPEMTGQLEDSQSDTVIARFYGVKIASRNFNVDARGMVMEDLTFVVRRGTDEAENV